MASPAPLCCPAYPSGLSIKALWHGYVLSVDTPSHSSGFSALGHRGEPPLRLEGGLHPGSFTAARAIMMSRYGLTHPAADQAVVEEKPETAKTHDTCYVTLVPTGGCQ